MCHSPRTVEMHLLISILAALRRSSRLPSVQCAGEGLHTHWTRTRVRNALLSRPRGCRVVDGAEPSYFGELLRRFRIESGLTQEDLAERAGLSARGVQDLERGVRRSPYPATTRPLAGALR